METLLDDWDEWTNWKLSQRVVYPTLFLSHMELTAAPFMKVTSRNIFAFATIFQTTAKISCKNCFLEAIGERFPFVACPQMRLKP